MTFAQFIDNIKEKNVVIDFELIKRAYEFANIAHADQKRLSGQSAVEHAVSVASVLIDFKVYDNYALCAAILHGVLEETAATFADLEKEFGAELATFIKTVDQLSTVKLYDASQEKYVENLRKMFLSAASDVRIVLVRLADRLDNLKTLKFLPEEKQVRIATETIEIFAPLAGRLGIGELKGELEDLAFPFVYKDEYLWTQKISSPLYKELNKNVIKVMAKLKIELQNAGIKAQVHGRSKHLYSLYKKLIRPEINRDISKIYDLIALRILVANLEDCYAALGIVHKLWRPMPNYVRDYIAMPKPNGYRSIHTTVFGPQGRLFEIQIRTFQMHDEAEFGVAAHWHYSEKKHQAKDKEIQTGFSVDEKLQWVKQLTAWQKDVSSSKEFLDVLKIDFFKDRIFPVTPKGDVKDLPSGATPIDFAYSIHTDLGSKCSGAKVNDKMVSLDYHLKSGDVVTILTSKDPAKKPSRDWLSFVATSLARHQIKRSLS